MQSRNPTGSFLLRLDDDQRAELNELAREADLPVQHYVEMRIFGYIKPRKAGRPRRNRDQLPLPIDEGSPIKKSA